MQNYKQTNFFPSSNNILRYFGGFDFFLIGAIFLLVAFSILALYSLDNGALTQNIKVYKQIGWVVISFISFYIFSILDYHQIKKSALLLFALAVFILTLVLLIGKTANGTTGWLNFGSVGFQPVELVKIILIIVLARFFSRAHFASIGLMILSLIFVSIPFILVMMQPDLGSGILFLVIWFGLIVLRGLNWRWILLFIFSALLIASLAWVNLKPYQKDRIMTFLDPFRDSSESSYQAVQSIITVGSGQLFGRGLGSGSQSQLHFLPEASTDFVFAAIAEEFGFFGIIIFFSSFGLLLYRLFITARSSRDNFSYLVVSGMFVLIASEVIINTAMNVGLFPIVGIPLPLISYGGSSLLSTFIGLGIVQSIYRQRKALAFDS